jgi:hypothetical protein
MTNQTQTIASAITQLGPALEALAKAEAELRWPDHEDQVVEWGDVLMQIDRVGTAAITLLGLVKGSVVAPLKELAALAQGRVGQLVALEKLVSPDATHPQPTHPSTPA